jgi:hypothetical protein
MKKIRTVAALFGAMVLAGCGSSSGGPAAPPDWNEVTVDGITLAWLPDGANLQVEVTAPSTGWVAAGFDPTTGMQDANIIIGYQIDTLTVIRDDWGNSPSTHRADTLLGGTDDILAYDGSENQGSTTLSFTIPLDSGDSFDKPLMMDSTYTVALGYAADGGDDFSAPHEFFTTTTITISIP